MRKLLLLLCMPFLFSCVEDDKPDSVVKETFSVTAASNYFGKYDEAYIILHDLDGKPLEFKQIHDGETIEFQVDKSKKYHVTEYKTDDSSGKHNSFLYTHLNQELTENLILSTNSSGVVEYAPNPVGEFEVNVKNSEPIYSLISAKGYASTYNESAQSVNNTMKYFSGVDRYLVVAANKSGHNRYQFIDSPELDKTYSLNYETMTEFEHVLKLSTSDYASLAYMITSVNPESAKNSPEFIIKPDFWDFNSTDFYEIGFISDIDNYITFIGGKKNPNSKTQFSYRKLGTAPSEIHVLDIDEILVPKSKISDFEVETVVAEVTYTSFFTSPLSYLNGTDFQFLLWTVISGNTTKFALELPEELKAANKLITNLDELRLSSVSISKSMYEKKSVDDQLYELAEVSQTFEY
ncbi:hypothetical protein [Algoriphagus aquimarinus]|uniref:Uncharacterized protein n=1 Tax=Algoriphagus aquimarinus TaxID=237018 RepID=A0A1I1BXV8_9BACT|nr:hypothetical protein [Algoriphagus aquimarinus]SFB55255.1 hypothetical protein SAMN04489723_11968 [Algoriphagus aquimarinus]